MLKSLHLIIPCWTMGEIEKPLAHNVALAVASGVGMAGCHGGMCDAFRGSVEWQFVTGGNWVCHPGRDGINYTVNIHNSSSPITEGLSDFKVCSEHYYLHYDPAVEVLASTLFPSYVDYYQHHQQAGHDAGGLDQEFWPGRVFYCSLGHHDDVFDNSPTAEVLMHRGMVWAARGKVFVLEQGLTPDFMENNIKNY
jgi:type 1 glutamine amidotransferase